MPYVEEVEYEEEETAYNVDFELPKTTTLARLTKEEVGSDLSS
jgi:hypothetical protein